MPKNYEIFEQLVLKNKELLSLIEKEDNETFEVINIDSKKESNNRNKLFNSIRLNNLENKYGFKINKASFLKGDILYKGKNKNLILDAKDYKEIDSRMKFPYKELKKEFTKTIDSNIKYLTYLDFIINNKNYKNLFDKIFNKEEINSTNFENFNIKITKKEFQELFIYFEYGTLNKELNIKGKYIISNKGNKNIIIQKLDFFKKLEENIEIRFEILNNNYLYLNFYNKNYLFYSISHRSYKEGKGYPQGNCAFLNKNYITYLDLNSKKISIFKKIKKFIFHK